MPNRSCDFCDNDYKKDPSVGYFKVTTYMKIKLELTSSANADYICGLHFEPSAFLENGRLKDNAVPTFFPSEAIFKHDHSYSTLQDYQSVHPDGQTCEIGKNGDALLQTRDIFSQYMMHYIYTSSVTFH